jgi:hypothetical protein
MAQNLQNPYRRWDYCGAASAGRIIRSIPPLRSKGRAMGRRQRRSLGFIAVAAAAGGILFLASAWVFYVDDRRPSHSSMVGTLVVDLPEGRGRGTAVLVDDCGILTNFHVVFGPWYVTALRAPSRAFRATFTLTEATLPDGRHPTSRATPVVWGDYRGPDRQIRNPGNDWVYLVLDQCLGVEHGYFGLRMLDAIDLMAGAEGFEAIGYSSERQMIDPGCSIDADAASTPGVAWRHDCALLAGDSGGPIVKRGTRTLVALGSSSTGNFGDAPCIVDDVGVHRDWDDRCTNLGVPVSPEIVDLVRTAQTAIWVQRGLSRLGYDAGPLGAVDEPLARTAIEKFQRTMGLAVTGEPSDLLGKIIWMQRGAS